jgi:hypothetical protein
VLQIAQTATAKSVVVNALASGDNEDMEDREGWLRDIL